MELVIYSESEHGFWSNDQGWVYDGPSATRFSVKEAKSLNMPVSKGNDAMLIKYDKDLLIIDEEVYIGCDDNDAVEAARQLHQKDGEIEVDDDAKTSRGDENGCYVQAWVWVPWRLIKPEPVELK